MVRPAVHRALAGVDLILHAGDVGGDDVLIELATIAPVRAVLGNTDSYLAGVSASIDERFAGMRVHVSHGHEVGVPGPAALLALYDADVIVYGHTHRQLVHRAADARLVSLDDVFSG
jgi:putative phosphoesterase